MQEAYLSKRLQTATRGDTADDTGHSHFKSRQAPPLHLDMVDSPFMPVAQQESHKDVLLLGREGVVAASAALTQPAANAEAAAAANAIIGSAPSTPPPDMAGASHRRPSESAAHSLGACFS